MMTRRLVLILSVLSVLIAVMLVAACVRAQWRAHWLGWSQAEQTTNTWREVIVASNTFIANWLAVTNAGAVVVPVEPDPATHNLDPDRIEAAITPRTRVICPTHLYGQPADLDAPLGLQDRPQPLPHQRVVVR